MISIPSFILFRNLHFFVVFSTLLLICLEACIFCEVFESDTFLGSTNVAIWPQAVEAELMFAFASNVKTSTIFEDWCLAFWTISCEDVHPLLIIGCLIAEFLLPLLN